MMIGNSAKSRCVNYFPERYLLLLFILGFCHLTIWSQNIRFTASSDADKVAVNTTFTLEYTLENAEGQSFSLPELSPFKIVGGPATSTSISIINGVRSGRMTYQYSVLATKTGRFTIPPAKIKAGNKILESNTITIEVVQPGKSTADLKADENELSFVRMEISSDQLVRGQQCVLDYVLYTRQNVESFNILSEPEFDGFYAAPPGDFRAQAKRHTINGKEYVSQILRRITLFPQKTGKYTLDPVICELAIPVEGSRGSFFFSRDIKRINFTTNTLNITVSELPENAPPAFSGAVGDYTMRAVINKNTVNTDDAIVIRMEIDGNGDSRIIKAPALPPIPNTSYYEPNTVRDEQYFKNGKTYNIKEFEYIIVPAKDTVLELTPEFSYYDPELKKYETLKAGPFKVEVIQSAGSKNTDTSPSLSQESISGIYPSSGLHRSGSIFFGSPVHLSILVIFMLAGIFLWLTHRRRQAEASEDPVEKRRKAARNVSVKRLQAALQLKQQGNFRGFFDEISKAVNGYIKDRFGLKNDSMDKANIISFLESQAMDESLISTFNHIHSKCEMAVFAGVQVSMDDMYEQALNWIEKVEMNW